MSEWDELTVGLILVGCSIVAAGIILGASLLGLLGSLTQFLLLTTIFLILMGAIVILYIDHKSGQDTKEGQ